jgi:hypothetical protein
VRFIKERHANLLLGFTAPNRFLGVRPTHGYRSMRAQFSCPVEPRSAGHEILIGNFQNLASDEAEERTRPCEQFPASGRQILFGETLRQPADGDAYAPPSPGNFFDTLSALGSIRFRRHARQHLALTRPEERNAGSLHPAVAHVSPRTSRTATSRRHKQMFRKE